MFLVSVLHSLAPLRRDQDPASDGVGGLYFTLLYSILYADIAKAREGERIRDEECMELSALDGLGWRFDAVAFFVTAVMLYPAKKCVRCDVPIEKEKHDSSPILQVRVRSSIEAVSCQGPR